jgi:hypothetical protein
MTVAITTQVTEQTLSVIESYKAVTMSDDDARDFATDLLNKLSSILRLIPFNIRLNKRAGQRRKVAPLVRSNREIHLSFPL